jgi:hypothetical protein
MMGVAAPVAAWEYSGTPPTCAIVIDDCLNKGYMSTIADERRTGYS